MVHIIIYSFGFHWNWSLREFYFLFYLHTQHIHIVTFFRCIFRMSCELRAQNDVAYFSLRIQQLIWCNWNFQSKYKNANVCRNKWKLVRNVLMVELLSPESHILKKKRTHTTKWNEMKCENLHTMYMWAFEHQVTKCADL